MAQIRPKFLFMDLEIWQDSIEVDDRLFDPADGLGVKRPCRFADQLRGGGMSMSNNIVEGSGRTSKREFLNFLNIARRPTFENANLLLVLEKRQLSGPNMVTEILDRLDHLCRKITNFQWSLCT